MADKEEDAQRNSFQLTTNKLDDFSSTNPILENEGLKLYVAPKGWRCQYTIAIMAFLGSIVAYTMRIDLSMAIVAMVNTKNDTSEETNVCNYAVEEDSTVEGEFDWTSGDKGIILGAFFWGYVATQIPGGLVAEKYGAKWVFGGGILLATIFHLLTPLAAQWGKGALIVSRVIQGIGEGVTPPATHVLIAQWAPPFERSKMGAFVYAGNQGGTMLAMLISGAIIDADFLGGWPGVFYSFGGIALIWLVFWSFLVYSRPSEHPRISQEELKYIENSMGGQTSKKHIPTPWKEIFTSKAVWAILIAQTGNGWGLYTLLTYMPTYMSKILHFSMSKNSLLSALPYFCMLLMALLTSWLADFCRTKKIFSTTVTRKIFNTTSQWLPAVALFGVAYSGCDKVLAVALLCVAVGFSGAAGGGYQVNSIDIAANHAGVLMGFCNGFSNLAGIAAPYVAGAIVTDETSVPSWRIVFFLSAGIYFMDNLIYILFATGQEQSWNRDKSEQKTTEQEEKER